MLSYQTLYRVGKHWERALKIKKLVHLGLAAALVEEIELVELAEVQGTISRPGLA